MRHTLPTAAVAAGRWLYKESYRTIRGCARLHHDRLVIDRVRGSVREEYDDI